MNDEQRALYTKFRISAHKLEIERGRYTGLNTEKRLCKLCKTNIEDEVHFLLQCHELQNDRLEIINSINELNINFKNLDNNAQLIWLMSSEDTSIIKKTGRLLLNLHTKRNSLLNS